MRPDLARSATVLKPRWPSLRCHNTALCTPPVTACCCHYCSCCQKPSIKMKETTMLASSENRVPIALQHNTGTTRAWAKEHCHALMHSRPDSKTRHRKVRDMELPVMFQCPHDLAPTNLQFPQPVQLSHACQNELAVAPQVPYMKGKMQFLHHFLCSYGTIWCQCVAPESSNQGSAKGTEANILEAGGPLLPADLQSLIRWSLPPLR
jgi:hypothetical protein